MRVIRAVNLLGDSLYLLKPIAEYRMQRPQGEEFAVGVMPGFAGDLLRAQFGRGLVRDMATLEDEPDIIYLSAGHAAQYAVQRLINHNERLHISECYAALIGAKTDRWNRDFSPLMGWANGKRWDPVVRLANRTHGYAVIAPFSKSCSRWSGSRPNKTPDHERWTLVIDWIKQNGFEPKDLTAPDENWTLNKDWIETADSLTALIKLLCGASFVITVDNGIGHIASALGCRTLILWPPITSVDFIGPIWNKGTTLMYMHPERIKADQLLRLVQKELAK